MLISDFKGMVPAKSEVLPLNYARTAINCDFTSGELRPGPGTEPEITIPKTGDIRTIYKIGANWIYWTEKVSIARAVTSTDRRQIYFAGDSYPRITDESMATAGSPPDYPVDTHRMGVTAPTNAPALAISKIEPSQGYGDVIEPVAYVYTCLARVRDGYVIEGGVSPPSVVVDAKKNMKLTVSGLTPPLGATHAGYRLYRMRAGSDATFRAVPFGLDGAGKPIYDIPPTETEFVDVDTSTSSIKLSLGEVCETEEWAVFPDATESLIEYQNSMVIGLCGNEIIPSAPLYQYPAIISQALANTRETVGGRAYGDVAIITTDERPLVLSGSGPGDLMLTKLPFDQGCLSERGMVVVESGVYYPSPEGMVFCDGAVAVPATKDLWRQEQWAALGPERLISLYHDAVLYLFFEGLPSGIVWDFKNEYISTIDVGHPVYHGHVVDDGLYLLVHDTDYKVVKLGGTQNYTWGTSWTGPNRPSPSLIRIDGDFNNKSVMVTITADNQMFSRIVTSSSPVAIKSMRGREITLTLSGNAPIKAVELDRTI